MEIRKTRIHGQINDKFTIKNKKEEFALVSSPEDESGLYPAVFNSEHDAILFLKSNDASDEEIDNLIIEFTPISFFDNGAVLVELDKENIPREVVIVKELLEKLEKFKNKTNYLVTEIVPLGESIEFRVSMTISDILIDEENKCVTLSNYKDSTMNIPTIDKIIDKLSNYEYYNIKLKVNDNLNTIYNEYMISCDINLDSLTQCIKLFTIKSGEYKI